jgi:hypothetical protein
MDLTYDDLQILTTAISWRLYTGDERVVQDNLGEENWQILRILLNELCCQLRACEFGLDSISVELAGQYSCSNGQMRITATHFQLMKNAIQFFVEDINNSSTEAEVLTGLPLEKTLEMLSRLKRGTGFLPNEPSPGQWV